MTFPARLTELIEKATKGPIIAYEDVQEAGKLKLFFSAIKDSNGENLVRASGAQSMSDFLLWAYLVNHAEAIRDLVAAAEKAAKMQIVEQWELQEALASLGHEKLAALESQPVPVDPECGRHDIVNDDKYGKIMGSVIGGDYVTYEDWEKLRDSLQSALKLAQEAKQAAVDLWSNTGETLQKADDTLRKISSVIGQGGMWDTENLDYDEVYARISDGINAHLNIQRERAEKAESLNRRMVELLKRLSFLAQTTGGTAGRDDDLVSAISDADELLREVDK